MIGAVAAEEDAAHDEDLSSEKTASSSTLPPHRARKGGSLSPPFRFPIRVHGVASPLALASAATYVPPRRCTW